MASPRQCDFTFSKKSETIIQAGLLTPNREIILKNQLLMSARQCENTFPTSFHFCLKRCSPVCFRSKKSKHFCFLRIVYTSVGFSKRWVVFQTHTKHLTPQNHTVYAAGTTLQTDRLVSRKVVNILKMLDFLKYLAWFRVFLKILLAPT